MVKSTQRSLIAGESRVLQASLSVQNNRRKTDDSPNTKPGHVEAKWFLYNRRTIMEMPSGSSGIR